MRKTSPSIALSACAFLLAARGHAAPIAAADLEAFLTFDEGSGETAVDKTGHGHDGTLLGSYSWGGASVVLNGGDGTMVSVVAGATLQGPSFTYDMWVQSQDFAGAPRLVAQLESVGAAGPDVFLHWSLVPAMRINNLGAYFLEPTVGSRSNTGPPDHYALCEDTYQVGSGHEHWVITHDSPAKTVRMFLGQEDDPLRICFEAEYDGTFDLSSGPLTIGNLQAGDRPYDGFIYQFAYYRRALTFVVGANRDVTDGELFQNHEAGPNADLPGDTPDAGLGGQGGMAGAGGALGGAGVAGGPRDDAGVGNGGTTSNGPADDGGCGCRLAAAKRGSGSPPLGMAWLAALLATVTACVRRGRRGAVACSLTATGRG